MAISTEDLRKAESVLVRLHPNVKGTTDKHPEGQIAVFEFEGRRYEIGVNGALGVTNGKKVDDLPISRGAYEHLLEMKKNFWQKNNPLDFTIEESKYQPKKSETFTSDEVKASLEKQKAEYEARLAKAKSDYETALDKAKKK